MVEPYYWPQFVLLGDSITEFSIHFQSGMPSYFGSKYRRQIDVINRGLSGYNTVWAKRVHEGIYAGLGGAPIRAIVIFYGANDAATNEQHVDLESFTANLRILGEEAYKHTDTVVFVGVGVVNEDDYRGPLETSNRTNREFYKYNRATKQVAEEFGSKGKDTHFVDFWTIMREQLGEDPDPSKVPLYIGEQGHPNNEQLREYLSDGLHFTDHSYKLLCGAIDSCLESKLGSLPMVPPHWQTFCFKE